MAIETSLAVVLIARYTLMIFIYLRLVRMFVTIYTAKLGENAGRGMTVNTLIPFISMFAAIDREIHPVMIEVGRYPGILTVTNSAVGREL